MVVQTETIPSQIDEQAHQELLTQFPEGDRYLEEFRELEPHQFAVIKVGGDIIDDASQLDLFASDLAKLQSVGLTPVVVHGGGSQITRAIEAKGFRTIKRDGLRVTPEEHVPHVDEALTAVNGILRAAIEKHGGSTAGITDIFEATLVDPVNRASVDSIVKVDTTEIENETAAGKIVVVSPIGYTVLANGQEAKVNINADISATSLALALGAREYISLTHKGGIEDGQGHLLDNLSRQQAEDLMSDETITDGAKVKVMEVLRLLHSHGQIESAVITSPAKLMTELLTEQGAGTMVHLGRTAVSNHTS